MRPFVRLAIALSGAALVLPLAARAQDETTPQLFISPMGEPFRAPQGQPYPSITWFNRADANHDGELSRQEFRADAMRFFKTLDANGDGVISDFEIQRYEYVIAPEIIAATTVADQSDASSDDDDDRNKHTALQNPRNGAAYFSFLQDAEPVRSADADINNKVTQEEWLGAADRRYDLLLPDGASTIKFSDLPLTPTQPLPDAKGKGKGKRK